jgi:hypothetical protein
LKFGSSEQQDKTGMQDGNTFERREAIARGSIELGGSIEDPLLTFDLDRTLGSSSNICF